MFTIGTIGFTGGNVIYYSFMPYLGKREDQDKVSTWGYMYGFMGGSMLLVFHLVILLGGCWDSNFTFAEFFSVLIVFPLVMTLAEAFAPHTWDTPFLFFFGFLTIYIVKTMPFVLN